MHRAFVLLSSLLSVSAAVQAAPGGWLPAQVLADYSALADKAVLIERLLAPTEADRMRRYEQAGAARIRAQSVDLAEERYDLFVPATVPAAGYAVLVFVSPGDDFVFPRDWLPEFERRGLLVVAARRSGNRENVVDRRIPLALHGYEHVQRHYRIDPRRVYVGGFSGGSRVAQRIALAYPDVFTGAWLIAGSDPIDGVRALQPRPALMAALRERTRMVFATGQEDLRNRARDADTRASLQAWCVANLRTVAVPHLGHWVPSGRPLRAALDALDAAPEPADPGCVAATTRAVAAELDRIEAQFGAGEARAAGIALAALEARAGGLAAPRSVELAGKIAAALAGSTERQ